VKTVWVDNRYLLVSWRYPHGRRKWKFRHNRHRSGGGSFYLQIFKLEVVVWHK